MNNRSVSLENRSTQPRRNKQEVFTPTTVLSAAVLAGTVLLAYGVSTSNEDKGIDRTAAGIDAAVESHNIDQMQELGMQQLDGHVVVKIGGNVRTTPVVSNDEGFENIDTEYTKFAETEESFVALKDPYVISDPANPENGLWYGAEDSETHEVHWVNQAAVVDVTGSITEPDSSRASHIYTMSESR